VFINVGYVIGLLPVTGIQLPLISAGGTSTATTLFMVGLMANAARHEPDAVAALRAGRDAKMNRLLRLPIPEPYSPTRVEALRDRFGLPGMKILQFAFDGDSTNPYLPANIRGRRWVVYTGTHDNATSVGWWQSLGDDARQRLAEAVGAPITAPAWQLLELALASPADRAVVPLQDLLELDDRARFNTPGTSSGNWTWRLQQPVASLDGALQGYGTMAASYGRAASAGELN
jgi:hypothetical protein